MGRIRVWMRRIRAWMRRGRGDKQKFGETAVMLYPIVRQVQAIRYGGLNVNYCVMQMLCSLR